MEVDEGWSGKSEGAEVGECRTCGIGIPVVQFEFRKQNKTGIWNVSGFDKFQKRSNHRHERAYSNQPTNCNCLFLLHSQIFWS